MEEVLGRKESGLSPFDRDVSMCESFKWITLV